MKKITILLLLVAVVLCLVGCSKGDYLKGITNNLVNTVEIYSTEN